MKNKKTFNLSNNATSIFTLLKLKRIFVIKYIVVLILPFLITTKMFAQSITKECVINDMSDMWFQLFEETGRIVLAPEYINDIKWDYSGNTVYVFFNDDMFTAPGNERAIALYYTLRNHKPTAGEGVCPVIFLRTNTLNLDRYIYETYMRPVLAHELIHYACALYDDFEGERNHDEMFKNCAKNMGAVLGMEIKINASNKEYELLTK